MKIISKLENGISVFLFASGVFISVYGVFMRYVLKQPQGWTTEFYTILLLWAIFIGFSSALRSNRHITVDLFYDRIKSKSKKFVNLFSYIIGIVFSSIFIFSGSLMVWRVFNQGMLSSDNSFPLWIYYLIMPISGLLLLIRFLELLYRTWNVNFYDRGDE